MFIDDNLLDSPTHDVEQRLPPALTNFEKYFFPIVFIIQYICILQMAMATGLEAVFGILIGGTLLFFTGGWQVIGGLVYMVSYPKNKARRLYFILAISDLVLLSLSILIDSAELAFFFAFVSSHALAWFYWYLSKKDSDLRQQMLQY